MNIARMLVVQLAVEDWIVGLAYIYYRDFARGVYWLTAGTLTLATLFMK